MDPDIEARATALDLEWFRWHPRRWYYAREPIPGEGASGDGCACVLVVQLVPGAAGKRVREGLSGWPSDVEMRRRAESIKSRAGGAVA